MRILLLSLLAFPLAAPALAQDTPPVQSRRDRIFRRSHFRIGIPDLILGIAYAPAQDATGGNDNIYLSADESLPLENTLFTFDAPIGRSEGDTRLTPGGGSTDWSLGTAAIIGSMSGIGCHQISC